MNRITVSYRWAVLFALSALASSAVAHCENGSVDAAKFLNSIVGSYKIEVAGGEAPHETNALGEVSVEGDEATITVPYCGHSGICDPGYQFFPLSATQLKVETGNADVPVYKLTVKDGATTLTYTWETVDGKVYFRNYQYELSPGKFVTLEHVLIKME